MARKEEDRIARKFQGPPFGTLPDSRTVGLRRWQQFVDRQLEQSRQLQASSQPMVTSREFEVVGSEALHSPVISDLLEKGEIGGTVYQKDKYEQSVKVYGETLTNRIFQRAFERYSHDYTPDDMEDIRGIYEAKAAGDRTIQEEKVKAFLDKFDHLTWQGLCWFMYANKVSIADPEVMDKVYPQWRVLHSDNEHFAADMPANMSRLERQIHRYKYSHMALRQEDLTGKEIAELLPVLTTGGLHLASRVARQRSLQPEEGDTLSQADQREYELLDTLYAEYLRHNIYKDYKDPRLLQTASNVISLRNVHEVQSPALILALTAKYRHLAHARSIEEFESGLDNFDSLNRQMPEDSITQDRELRPEICSMLTEFSTVMSEIAGDNYACHSLMDVLTLIQTFNAVPSASEQPLTSFAGSLNELAPYFDVLQRLTAEAILRGVPNRPIATFPYDHARKIADTARILSRHYSQAGFGKSRSAIEGISAGTSTVKRDLGMDTEDLILMKEENDRNLLANSTIVLARLHGLDRSLQTKSIEDALGNIMAERMVAVREINTAEKMNDLHVPPVIDKYTYYDQIPSIADPMASKDGTNVVAGYDVMSLGNAAWTAFLSSAELHRLDVPVNTEDMYRNLTIAEACEISYLSQNFNYSHLDRLLTIYKVKLDMANRFHREDIPVIVSDMNQYLSLYDNDDFSVQPLKSNHVDSETLLKRKRWEARAKEHIDNMFPEE